MLKLNMMPISTRKNIDSFHILCLPSSVISESSKNSKKEERGRKLDVKNIHCRE